MTRSTPSIAASRKAAPKISEQSKLNQQIKTQSNETGGNNEHKASFLGRHDRTRQHRAACDLAGTRRRRDAGSAGQCRQGAAQLADEPPHLRRAALFTARQDQQGQRQGPQARLFRRHRRHVRQRKSASDTARRGRLPLHRRSVGRGLQDRRALRRHGPHRLAHGPGPGEVAAVESRRGACGAISF